MTLQMLPKENRLKKKKGFDNVIKEGSYASEGFLVLKFRSNGLDLTRAGFVVSRKVAKKAVTRNKLKRQLREALRPELKEVRRGFDLVFFAKREITEKEFPDIQSIVRRLLERANLYT